MEREKVIVRTSMIGILANIFLASFKAAVGILSSSIAVRLDAVNNLSDVMSSVITIIGTKLAEKKPDNSSNYNTPYFLSPRSRIMNLIGVPCIPKVSRILFSR